MERKENFIQCEKHIFEAYGFESPVSKKIIPLSPIDKIIYLVMRDRYEFFVIKQGGEYHESQETTAERCGTFRRKVNEAVRMFMREGIIRGRKVRTKVGNVSWVYDYIGELKLVKKEGEVWISERMMDKAKNGIVQEEEDMGKPDW